MAAAEIYRADGILVFVATNDFTFDRAETVDHIVLTGTAAGSFAIVIGEATLTITTGANDLSKVIPINRHLDYMKLTSGPTAATMYVFLRKK